MYTLLASADFRGLGCLLLDGIFPGRIVFNLLPLSPTGKARLLLDSHRFVALMTFSLRSCYAKVSDGLEVMKGLRLALCVLPFLSGGVVYADSISTSMIQLQVGQPIRMADASLLASGWLPKPDQATEVLNSESSGPTLPSLSSCSGTGVGFCRYDYARDRQRLSVVTVPSPSSDVSGLVQRWWIE